MSDTEFQSAPVQSIAPQPIAQPAPVAQQEAVGGFNFGELMVDEGSAKDGVWVDFYGGSRLRIASTNSPSYKSKLTKLARANKLILDDSNPENYEAVQRITAEALATTVLLDWQGIHWPNGDGTNTLNVAYTPVSYTHLSLPMIKSKFPEQAKDLLAKGIDVVNATRDTAVTCFRQQALEDVLTELTGACLLYTSRCV